MHSLLLSRWKNRELRGFADLAFYGLGGGEPTLGFRLAEVSERKSRLAGFQNGNYYFFVDQCPPKRCQ